MQEQAPSKEILNTFMSELDQLLSNQPKDFSEELTDLLATWLKAFGPVNNMDLA